MLILVINCGSSSAKYQLFDLAKRRSLALRPFGKLRVDGEPSRNHRRCSSPMVSLSNHKVEPLAKGLIERIGQPGHCENHYEAIALIAGALTDKRTGAIRSKDEIGGIGHRVVHGGEEFKASTLITNSVIKSIEKYAELAPLHNPPSLSGIRACLDILKGIPQVAVFDTSFHQTMPEKAFLYGLPYKYYEKYGVRKYGFHGTSHRWVAKAAAGELNRPLERLKIITCHLGNGCSMAAVDRGESIDTTMGFTPLEGLLMGTRSGDLDPAVVFYLMEREGLSPRHISDLLNKKSGLLGISGVSNDMRDLLKASKSKSVKASARAKLAIDIFIYRIEKYIGAYQAAMKGLDAVVFTAGIGEHNPWLVSRIKKDLKSVVNKRAKFLVIPANEELLIARDTYEIIKEGSV
ncbi:MAG: acetate kinase [Candidatus Omnitrophica bacterium]|nr:acetate kinase [Candidatus Omnitrophota bacterium]